MGTIESLEEQAYGAFNSIKNLKDMAMAVSAGTFKKGEPGSVAVMFELGVYRIVAKFENVTDPPPRIDIETKHPVFWDKAEIQRLEILLDLLIEENKRFVTKAGDGSGENPIVILRWEREFRTCALRR
jgi:hypothetical protein